jgi:hypothetical protein
MKVQIKFQQINPEYDKVYAKFHGESYENLRHRWEVGFQIENVNEIRSMENTVFNLNTTIKETNEKIEFKIPKVNTLEFVNDKKKCLQ